MAFLLSISAFSSSPFESIFAAVSLLSLSPVFWWTLVFRCVAVAASVCGDLSCDFAVVASVSSFAAAVFCCGGSSCDLAAVAAVLVPVSSVFSPLQPLHASLLLLLKRSRGVLLSHLHSSLPRLVLPLPPSL